MTAKLKNFAFDKALGHMFNKFALRRISKKNAMFTIAANMLIKKFGAKYDLDRYLRLFNLMCDATSRGMKIVLRGIRKGFAATVRGIFNSIRFTLRMIYKASALLVKLLGKAVVKGA